VARRKSAKRESVVAREVAREGAVHRKPARSGRTGRRTGSAKAAPASRRGAKEGSTTKKASGRRDVIVKAPAKAAASAKTPTRPRKRGTTPKAAGRPTRNAARRVHDTSVSTRLMRIRELDPQAACGNGTTVMQLFRVDDLPVGSATAHLVFFDRHGWYCEHGRECPAVAAVKKHNNAGTSRR